MGERRGALIDLSILNPLAARAEGLRKGLNRPATGMRTYAFTT
jgi:hypothetical protein